MREQGTRSNVSPVMAREGITLFWISDPICEGEINGEQYTGIVHGDTLRIIKNSTGGIVATMKATPATPLDTQLGELVITWKGKWGNLWICGVDNEYENDGEMWPAVTLFGIKRNTA